MEALARLFHNIKRNEFLVKKPCLIAHVVGRATFPWLGMVVVAFMEYITAAGPRRVARLPSCWQAHMMCVCACVRACVYVQLVDSGMDLPSLKRLCQCRTPDFAPLPSLISSRMALAHMEASVSGWGWKVGGVLGWLEEDAQMKIQYLCSQKKHI